MANRPTQVSVGAVVNPLEQAGKLFTDYIDKQQRDAAQAEEQRRWEITNNRTEDELTRKAAQAKQEQDRWEITNNRVEDELARKATNSAGLSQLINTASRAMPAYALAGNVEDRDIINKSAVDAWNRTIAQSPELVADKSRLDALQASGEASYDDVEAFRKKVMNTTVGAGGSQYKDIVDRVYRGYTPYQEEATRAIDTMASGIKGIDPVQALAVRDKLAQGYMSKADANQAFADSRKEELAIAKDERDYQFKIDKANQVAESKKQGSGSSGKSTGNQYGQIADAETELKNFMKDKEGYFRAGGLGTGNITKELLQKPLTPDGLTAFEYAELKGIKPSEVTGLIKDAIVLTQKEGWKGYKSPIAAVKEKIIDHANSSKYKGNDTSKPVAKIVAKQLPNIGGTRDLGAERLNKATRAFGDIFPGGVTRNLVPTSPGDNKQIPGAEKDALAKIMQRTPTSVRATRGNVGLDLEKEYNELGEVTPGTISTLGLSGLSRDELLSRAEENNKRRSIINNIFYSPGVKDDVVLTAGKVKGMTVDELRKAVAGQELADLEISRNDLRHSNSTITPERNLDRLYTGAQKRLGALFSQNLVGEDSRVQGIEDAFAAREQGRKSRVDETARIAQENDKRIQELKKFLSRDGVTTDTGPGLLNGVDTRNNDSIKDYIKMNMPTEGIRALEIAGVNLDTVSNDMLRSIYYNLQMRLR